MSESPRQSKAAIHNERMKDLKTQISAEIKQRRDEPSLVVVNTGEGKGKSTAAFGLALRALGHGMRVLVVQFIKGTWQTGEEKAFARFDNLDFIVGGDGFPWDTGDFSGDVEKARRTWELARTALRGEGAMSGKKSYQVIVLDEINVAMDLGYLDAAGVAEEIRGRSPEISVVLTGRGAPPEILEVGDTVTRMNCIKHAYDSGIAAQKGIEF